MTVRSASLSKIRSAAPSVTWSASDTSTSPGVVFELRHLPCLLYIACISHICICNCISHTVLCILYFAYLILDFTTSVNSKSY
jgi:hypothetical protein